MPTTVNVTVVLWICNKIKLYQMFYFTICIKKGKRERKKTLKMLHEFCTVVCSHTRLITRNTISCIHCLKRHTFRARVPLKSMLFFFLLLQTASDFSISLSLAFSKFFWDNIQIYFLFQAHCKNVILCVEVLYVKHT